MIRLSSILARIRDEFAVQRVRGRARPPRWARIVLLCRVENGKEYAQDFLRHYRALGVDHMIFLDTGSSDGTTDLLTGDDITVYKTSLPFKTHHCWMRRWLMRRCRAGTWTLSVDMDELFDYPLSAHCSLSAFIAYLDANGYSAMRAHMLDMFASGPLGMADAADSAPLIQRYPWYDISNIAPIPSFFPFGDMPAYRGGIRATLFGGDHFMLTKHPLIRIGSGVDAFTESEHWVKQAQIADVTGVLLHFKFTENFLSKVHEAVERGQYWNESKEYKLYAEVLSREPSLVFKREGARKWTNATDLVEQGFLEMSDAYRQHAASGV